MIRPISLAALVALLIPSPSAASLAVALCTPERCVLASDSRTWDTQRDVAGGDTARKVDVRAGYAFMMTGWPGVFDAWTATAPRPGESAEALARRVLAAVVPDDEGQEAAIGILRFGAFLDAYVAKVTIAPDGAPTILEDARPAPPFAFTLGWDDGGAARDGLVQVTQRELQQTTPTEARLRELATGILTAAARQSVKVGGPSHIAILDAQGARWLTPTRHGEHWDGTNLTIVSQSITIDQSGVRFSVPSGFSDTTSYRWDVTDGFLGTKAQFNSNQYDLMLQGYYSGSTTSTVLNTSLSSIYDASSGGNQSIAAVTATAYADLAEVVITAAAYTGDPITTHQIRLNGELQLENQLTQTTIGANGSASALTANPAGYLKIKINGTYYIIPAYNP
ncbi:MAG: hypothetical protein IT177_22545 [Acidobacteria bacterium]|nr:hypothetical protein [Acidobacteriota bacterium]